MLGKFLVRLDCKQVFFTAMPLPKIAWDYQIHLVSFSLISSALSKKQTSCEKFPQKN
jgi:hypothetical protein